MTPVCVCSDKVKRNANDKQPRANIWWDKEDIPGNWVIFNVGWLREREDGGSGGGEGGGGIGWKKKKDNFFFF